MYFRKMNYFDVLVFIILTYGLLSGFFKGFVVEIAGVIALIIGLLGSFKFSNILGNTIEVFIDWNPKTIQIVSFIVLFILIIYSISLLAKVIRQISPGFCSGEGTSDHTISAPEGACSARGSPLARPCSAETLRNTSNFL